jgi:predicted nucleic acid-binding protein
MATAIIWVLDTSSIIEIRRSVAAAQRNDVFLGMGNLVAADRIFFPKQVVEELERAADPKLPMRSIFGRSSTRSRQMHMILRFRR